MPIYRGSYIKLLFISAYLTSSADILNLLTNNAAYAGQSNGQREISYMAYYQSSSQNSTRASMPDQVNVPKQISDENEDNQDSSGETGNQYNTTQEAETIVVTGSHIRGVAPVGSNLQVFSREDLDKSGYATVQDFIQALPQHFQGGGGSEDPSSGTLNTSNQMSGSTINLRGLGPDSTLVLINGRRTPQSGLEGNFVDVSLIPQTAIERIELLPDSASALYGSDAIGGVVNFVLRKDYDGVEARFRYGTVTEGGAEEIRFAQMLGHAWSNGHALFSYEYYGRDHLAYGQREYAATRDQRSRGGADYRFTDANPGNILDPFTGSPAYAIPKGQDGKSLEVESLILGQVNLDDVDRESSLLPRQRRHSTFATVEQSLSETVIIFAEGTFSERKSLSYTEAPRTPVFVPDSNPYLVDPFGIGFALVSYSFAGETGLLDWRSRVRNYGGTAGTQIDLSSWRWETSASYSEEKSRIKYDTLRSDLLNIALADPNPRTALNVFGDGRVNDPNLIFSLFSEETRAAKSKLFIADTILDGPLGSIFNREISLAMGINYRSEKFQNSREGGEVEGLEKLSRKVYAAYGEIFSSILPEDDNRSFIQSVELSLAGRIENYNDLDTTFNPKIGLQIKLAPGFIINGNYGTSYRSPNLTELSLVNNITYISNQPDSKSPTGFSQVLLFTGNNPNTNSEKAQTWTITADIRPINIPDLAIQISYFDINFRDRISRPRLPQDVLSNEELYPGLIIRNPSTQLLQSLCNDEFYTRDTALCTSELVRAVIDMRNQNMARNIVRGLDISLNYGFNLIDNNISLGLNSSYIIDYLIKTSDSAPSRDVVDTINNPTDLRMRGNVSVSRNGISSAVFLNYTDSYKNNISQLQDRVKSYFSLDFNISLNFNRNLQLDSAGPLLINFSAINIFDERPPFADDPTGYDPNNFDPLGRFLSAEVRLKF